MADDGAAVAEVSFVIPPGRDDTLVFDLVNGRVSAPALGHEVGCVGGRSVPPGVLEGRWCLVLATRVSAGSPG